MVALKSSRRSISRPVAPVPPAVDLPSALGIGPADQDEVAARATRRTAGGVQISRDRLGQIATVQIGRWRTLASAPQRRLAEVRELSGHRVAVKIERLGQGTHLPSSEIWQLYDLEGRLEAAMQTTPDGRFAMLTNYRTRQACRLALNVRGVLQTVETWNI